MLLVADILFKMKLLLLLLLPCAALPMPAHRTRSPVPLLARQVLHEASSVIQAATWKVYVAAETAAETETGRQQTGRYVWQRDEQRQQQRQQQQQHRWHAAAETAATDSDGRRCRRQRRQWTGPAVD